MRQHIVLTCNFCHVVNLQESLWGRLGELHLPVLVVAGAKDPKFVELSMRMIKALPPRAAKPSAPVASLSSVSSMDEVEIGTISTSISSRRTCLHSAVERLRTRGAGCFIVPGAGHAVHSEEPLLLLQCLLRAFSPVS